MEKVIKISELKKGEKVNLNGDVTVNEKIAKNGGKYKSLKIEDTSGVAYAVIFDNDKLFFKIQKKSFYAGITACVNSVKDSTSKYNTLTLLDIKEIERNDVDNIVNIESLKTFLSETIKNIKNPGFKELLYNLFKREDINPKFFEVPASEKTGYSFRGGLLVRVVRLIKLSKAIKKVYDEMNFNLDGINTKLNEELLITASILSEVGRVKQYVITSDKKIEKTNEGKLFDMEHISNKIICEELQKIEGLLGEEEKLLLEHVTASVLGGVFPSSTVSTVPRTKEAFAFSLISFLDRKLADIEFLERDFGKVDFAELFGKVICLQQIEEVDSI